MMQLKIALPTGLIYRGDIQKISAEAVNGAFTMLPRHIDFVTILVPSILFFTTTAEADNEVFFAVDNSILVKRGPGVLVSTRNAVRSRDLESLKQNIHQHFEVLDDHERQARSALARMEADFVKRFLELESQTHG